MYVYSLFIIMHLFYLNLLGFSLYYQWILNNHFYSKKILAESLWSAKI
jgi:hypothetical protein